MAGRTESISVGNSRTGIRGLTEDGLESVRSRESIDGGAGGSSAFDRATKRNNESLHVLLRDRLNERIERLPRSSNDLGCPVVKQRNEHADPIDGVVGEVALGGLAKLAEEGAAGDALRRCFRLGEAEHVHLKSRKTAVVVDDGGEDGGEGFVDLQESVLVLLGLERVLEGVDDVGETLAECRPCDADEGGECACVKSGNGSGDEARDKDGEDLVGADLHDLGNAKSQIQNAYGKRTVPP